MESNPIIELPAQPEHDPENPTVHSGVYCDGPKCPHGQSYIKGIRYKCFICADADYCGNCFNGENNKHNRSHPLLRCVKEAVFARKEDQAKIREALPAATFHTITADDIKSQVQANEENEEEVNIEPSSASHSEIQTIGEIPSGPSIVEYMIKEGGVVEKHFRPIHPSGTVKIEGQEEPEKGVILHDFLTPDGLIAPERYNYSAKPQFYKLLAAGQPATRVIDLAPGTGHDRLKCTIRVINLNEPPEYEALSYTWYRTPSDRPTIDAWSSQDDENHRNTLRWDLSIPIFVDDDKFIGISPGLRDALRALRHPTKSRVLWVDQLCIDQSSTKEREIQVRYMSHVYSKSQRVVLWVGEEEPNTGAAFGILQSLGNYLTKVPKPPMPNLQNLSQILDLADVPDLSADSVGWRAVHDIFKRPVFQRGWVVQEVTRGSQLLIKCGRHEISWAKMMAVVYPLSKFLSVFLDRRETMDTAPRPDLLLGMDETRMNFWRMGSSVRLFNSLHATRLFKTSVPHDKIYSLIGLREPAFDIQPNYTQPVMDVCIEATKWVLTNERNFSICVMNQRDEQHHFHKSAWPSWVPNFADPVGLPVSLSHGRPWRAAGSSVASVSWPVKDKPNTMEALAYKCSTVDAVANTPPAHLGFVGKLTVFMFLAESLGPRYQGSTTTAEAFLRTCFVNTSEDLSPISTEEISSLASWLSRFVDEVITGDEPMAERFHTPFFLDLAKIGKTAPNVEMAMTWDLTDSSATLNVSAIIGKRTLFTTSDGYLGLGPSTMAPGDAVYVIAGGCTPFILRERPGDITSSSDEPEAKPEYSLIGEAYVHGLMNGEIMRCEGMEWANIRIV
ncbi:unnamed protein product [Clonostachys rhizophaga]|uniref:Heterokaryon incompatibility domain-containing protein n=1 Tax=Clonostachys rhizophaga TaxID=160324 RepID=A0A9N9V3I9_9HYPO|nr:unnamed protein product [Clonostachys rhizophaga]